MTGEPPREAGDTGGLFSQLAGNPRHATEVTGRLHWPEGNFVPMWWTVWWVPSILTGPLMLGLLVEAIWGSRNPGVAWIAVGAGYGLIAAFSVSGRRR